MRFSPLVSQTEGSTWSLGFGTEAFSDGQVIELKAHSKFLDPTGTLFYDIGPLGGFCIKACESMPVCEQVCMHTDM